MADLNGRPENLNPDKALTFELLCQVLKGISLTRSEKEKIGQFASYLQRIEDEDHIELAVRFTSEGASPTASGKRTGIGSLTIHMTAAHFCGIDYPIVFKACRQATGSASEAVEKLINHLPAAKARCRPAFLTLKEMESEFSCLAALKNREDKVRTLMRIWKRMTPLEVRFMIRMLGRWSTRAGLDTRSLLYALAEAFGHNPAEIRKTLMLTGDIGYTARLACTNTLESAIFQMHQPISFMLASPPQEGSLNSGSKARKQPEPLKLPGGIILSRFCAEEKFDGMRAQAHLAPGKICLFSRDLNEISDSFPDITRQLHQSYERLSPCEGLVLDGELCVFEKQSMQSVQRLQKRMGVKKPGNQLIRKHPVLFIAFDLLVENGQPVLDEPLAQRRKRLEKLAKRARLPISRQYPLRTPGDIERLYRRALEHGNEGLVIKDVQSSYEYGQRNRAWLKIRQPRGTLCAVIMYAHSDGRGRDRTCPDFTLGIRVDEDDRFTGSFIPIGRACCGYTQEELKELNLRIRELAVERFGTTLSLKPGIAVEIEYDDIRENRRAKAGYVLKSPRFRTIRWDFDPSAIDTLEKVELLYRQRLIKTHRPSGDSGPFYYPEE